MQLGLSVLRSCEVALFPTLAYGLIDFRKTPDPAKHLGVRIALLVSIAHAWLVGSQLIDRQVCRDLALQLCMLS